MEGVVLNGIGILRLFCPKQGQGIRSSAVPLHPNMSQVPPPENIIAFTNEICIFLYRFHSLSNEPFLTKTILQKCQS